jgi:hypothetical protein
MNRELVILVADGTMRAVFAAFFERQFHHVLSCAPFDFNPRLDLFNNPLEKDGGVHRRCHEILRPYLNTHRRALVVLDQQFGGERPAEEVRVEIEHRLNANGWAGRATAAVIEPELEVLLWQDNVNVERALRHQGGSLRQLLAADGRWPEGCAEASRSQRGHPGADSHQPRGPTGGRLQPDREGSLDGGLRGPGVPSCSRRAPCVVPCGGRMKAKSVPSSWLERDGRRLDCNPYMSGALEAKVLLEGLRPRRCRSATSR